MRKIFTITGPSCSGKTTLVRKLLASGEFVELISTTSRSPRDGEKNGIDYFFKTALECEQLEEDGEFAEHIEFNGNHYGIETSSIKTAFGTGLTPVIIVEPKGLRQLKKQFCCYSIYVDGHIETIYTRFLTRFKENPDAVPEYEAKRLASIQKEHSNWWQDATYNQVIPDFNKQNEEEIVNTLRVKATLLRKENDQS